jgi:EEF1A lysine methyltransferase 4
MAKRKTAAPVAVAVAAVPAVAEAEASSYSEATYWNERNDQNVLHEWYYSYDHLRPLLQQTIRQDRPLIADAPEIILEIGCGDAPLIRGILDDEEIHGTFIGIDFSRSVIESLNHHKAQESLRLGTPSATLNRLQYELMDARHLSFGNETIHYILEKGTIDAMLCSDDWTENLKLIFGEMCRVLRVDGSIVWISHLNYDSEECQEILETILMPILSEDHQRVWNIHIHCAEDAEEESEREEEEGEGEQATPGATVYIITSRERRVTRSLNQKKPLTVQVKVSTYESERSS